VQAETDLGLDATSHLSLLGGRYGYPALCDYVEVLARQRYSPWAWRHYKDVLADLLRIRKARRIMEIGAGRFPLFERVEIARFGIEYIANDIDAMELERAPDEVGKVCFDISTADAGEVASLKNAVDLAFSKMVFEHLPDVKQAYRNIFEMLSPGGICLNFHPILFSPPFVANYLLPTTPAERLLKRLSPRRNHDDHPKFPASYDHCWVSRPFRGALRAMGYRKVWQLPFWSHEYFVKFPGVRECDRIVNKLAERANWTSLASYCYTIVVK
jgi:2-polyprenyl-3-methyl-5-hydroxy-6-metoxy-1,4-benzoquinol methylase